jgi:hypothetical protein
LQDSFIDRQVGEQKMCSSLKNPHVAHLDQRVEITIVVQQECVVFKSNLRDEEVNSASDGEPFFSAFSVQLCRGNVRFHTFHGEYRKGKKVVFHVSILTLGFYPLQYFRQRDISKSDIIIIANKLLYQSPESVTVH